MKRVFSILFAAVMMFCLTVPCVAEGVEQPTLSEAEIGDVVSFGAYVQEEGKDAEAIAWRVLDEQDGCLLLISEKSLDCYPYYDGYIRMHWRISSLREWLNADFLNEAFTAEEQEQIMAKTQRNKKNPYYGHATFKDTSDKVFVLSIAEANEYFSYGEAGADPTPYALQKATEHDTADIGWWWLRNNGKDNYYFAGVPADGTIFYGGYAQGHYGYVRPAIWVNAE